MGISYGSPKTRMRCFIDCQLHWDAVLYTITKPNIGTSDESADETPVVEGPFKPEVSLGFVSKHLSNVSRYAAGGNSGVRCLLAWVVFACLAWAYAWPCQVKDWDALCHGKQAVKSCEEGKGSSGVGVSICIDSKKP